MLKSYKVWWPERGQERDDAKTVLALDAEGAASKWAKWYDHHSSDYAIVGGEMAAVQVAGDDDGAPITVNVFGEMIRSYRARAATPSSQGGQG